MYIGIQNNKQKNSKCENRGYEYNNENIERKKEGDNEISSRYI